MTINYKIACVQTDCFPCDIGKNLEKVKSFLVEAKNKGAKLAVLPELFNIGYDLNLFRSYSEYDVSETKHFLSTLSKELDLFIVAGIADQEGGSLQNSACVFDNHGNVICKYNKMNLFPLSEEKNIFTEGSQPETFSIGDFKVGLLICYDIRFPEVTTKYFEEGCNVFIILSAFPFPRLEHWKTLIKARAIESQSYVIACNRVGKDGDMTFLGNSCIIDPWGTEKANLNETEEGVLLGEINMDKILEVRSKMTCFENKTKLLTYLRESKKNI
ncbi:MAG: carbon-nitrogen family hydrolase [Bacillota bacterium]|nr:carbon-nitrogen family hydrolase [Bacillota bacterium]